MSVSEEQRNHLHGTLSGELGADDAAVLMSYLPPTGWADVATKRDLDALQARMDVRFAQVDARFVGLEAALRAGLAETREMFHREMRIMSWRVLVALLTALSINVALLRL